MTGSIVVTRIGDCYKVLTPNDDLNERLELKVSHFKGDRNFTVCLDGRLHRITFVLHDDYVSIRYGLMFVRLSYNPADSQSDVDYPVFTNKLLDEYIDNANNLYLHYNVATHDDCAVGANVVMLNEPCLTSIRIVDHKIRYMCSIDVSIPVPWLKVKHISTIICKLYLSFQKDVSVVSRVLGRKYDGLYTNNWGTNLSLFTYKGDAQHKYKTLLENHFLEMVRKELATN